MECLHYIGHAELILDWYHLLKKKRKELCCMIARGQEARDALLNSPKLKLWLGKVADASSLLAAYRPQTKNEKKLDELMGYLRKHQAEIPDYNERRIHCQFSGGRQMRKTKDLFVARRQKHQGMHWDAILPPISPLIALAVRLESRGRQCSGKNGREKMVLPS